MNINNKLLLTLKKLIKTDNFYLVLAIAWGLILRTYNFSSLFYYGIDEEIMNQIQRRIVLGEHYPIIGSFSPIGTFLGPYFYYLGALILRIARLNPLGLGIFGAFVGTFNILLIYLVVKDIFNKKIAVLSSFLYSSSFLMVIFDRRYWHLTPGPFLSLIVLWSLYKIKNGSIKFIYLLTAALIFGWNTDYTNIVLFLFTFLAWVIFRLPIRKKEILFAVIFFILSNIPLAIFDARHDLYNLKAVGKYFGYKYQVALNDGGVKEKRPEKTSVGANRFEQAGYTALQPVITYSRALFVLSSPNITLQQSYCKGYIDIRNKAQNFVLPCVALILLVLFIYLTFKRKNQKSISYKLVLAFYLIYQLGLLSYAFLFNGDVFEHYLAALLPFYFIISAVVLYDIFWILNKKIVFVIVAVFISANSYLLFNAYNPYGYANKLKSVNFALKEVGNNDFSFYTLGNCFGWDGYLYTFFINNRHPVRSFQDDTYSWLFDYTPSKTDPSRIVVIVPRSDFEDKEFYQTYYRYQKWVIDRKKFGNIEVLILDNSRGDFH